MADSYLPPVIAQLIGTADMSAWEDAAEEAEEAAARLEAAGNEAGTGLERAGQDATTAGEDVEQAGEQFAAAGEDVGSGLPAALEQIGPAAEEAAQALQQAAESAQGGAGEFAQLGEAAQTAGQELELYTGGAQDAADASDRIPIAMAPIGPVALDAGKAMLAIAQGAQEWIDESVDLEQALADAQTALGKYTTQLTNLKLVQDGLPQNDFSIAIERTAKQVEDAQKTVDQLTEAIGASGTEAVTAGHDLESLGSGATHAAEELGDVIDATTVFSREQLEAAQGAAVYDDRLDRLAITSGNAGGELEKLGQAGKDAAQVTEEAGQAAEDAGKKVERSAQDTGSLGDAWRVLSGSLNRTPDLLSGIGMALGVVAPALVAAGAGLTAMATGGAVALLGLQGIEQAGAQLDAGLGVLKGAATDAFMKTLLPAVDEASTAFPKMKQGVSDVATAMGGMVQSFADYISSAKGVQQINDWMEGTAQFLAEGKQGVTSLADAWMGFLDAAAPAMQEFGKDIAEGFDDFDKMIQAASQTGTITKAIQGAGDVTKGLMDVLTAVVKVLLDISAQAGPQAGEALEAIAKAITDAAPAIVSFVEGFSKGITVIAQIIGLLGAFKDPFTYITGALAALGVGFGIFETLLRPIGKLIGVLGDLAEALGLTGGAAEAAAGGEGLGALAGVADALSGPIGWLITAIVAIGAGAAYVVTHWDQVGGFFSDLWGKIKDAFSTGADAVGKVTESEFDNILDMLKNLPTNAGTALGGLTGTLAKAAKDGFDGFLQTTSNELQNVGTFFGTTLPAAITAAVQNGPTWLAKTAKDILDGFIANCQNEEKSAIQFFSQTLPNDVVNAVKDAGKWLAQTGKDLIDGLVKGLSDAASSAVQAVTDFCSSFVDAFKKAFGVQSPSTITADIGKNIVAGLVQGIEDGASDAINAIEKLAKSVLDAAKQALGIQSPSWAFHEFVGHEITRGWSEGIIHNAREVTDAVRHVAGQAVAAGHLETPIQTTSIGGGGYYGTPDTRGGQWGGGGNQQIECHFTGGSDSAIASLVQGMFRKGQIKISANSLVRGRAYS